MPFSRRLQVVGALPMGSWCQKSQDQLRPDKLAKWKRSDFVESMRFCAEDFSSLSSVRPWALLGSEMT
jgi:hypothetical protein